MTNPMRRQGRAAPRGLLLGCTLLALTATGGQAQQTTGAPGAPNATTTIDGRYLPPSRQPFQGDINLNAAQSKPAWPARVVPPQGAPNILLIMTDDVGFAAPSTFGGVIPTPTLDRIAANGLRNTNFHSTSLFRNTTAIYPYVGNPGWNLTTAMADDAIHWMNQLNDINPSMPFFLHYVPGGTHAPHQPTPEWIGKISDMHLFDKGWNALRDQIFANQKRLGVIPQDAKLTPWPDKLS